MKFCRLLAQVKRENLKLFHLITFFDSSGFVNDPRSCSAYFSCISFLPFEVKCPSPFYFNGNNLCDWPENVACNNCPSTGVHRIAIPESCTRWTLCVNGISLPQECGPGTAFDERIGTCNIAEDVNCGVNTCGKVQNLIAKPRIFINSLI